MFYTWFKKYLLAREMERQADIDRFNRWMKEFEDLTRIDEE
jgi:hypothetical protein